MSKSYEDIDKAYENQCGSCVNLVKSPYLDLCDKKLFSWHCCKGINPREIADIECKEYINMIVNK